MVYRSIACGRWKTL
uniref:Uncharacterized protein n=1 Tax=Arundo donax TaxID=35708 RepID=A0A0A9B439_ARUDO